jgi:hypothetical protein
MVDETALIMTGQASRSWGFSLHSGEGSTTFSAVHYGMHIAKPIVVDVASGEELTQIVRGALCEQYPTLSVQQARTIKESLGQNTEYELPDGTVLKLDKVQEAIEKTLFVRDKLHEKIHDYMDRISEFQRGDFYTQMVWSGATTRLPSFDRKHIKNMMCQVQTNSLLCNPADDIKIQAYPGREDVVWTGLSIVGAWTTFRANGTIRKQQYEEGRWFTHLLISNPELTKDCR